MTDTQELEDVCPGCGGAGWAEEVLRIADECVSDRWGDGYQVKRSGEPDAYLRKDLLIELVGAVRRRRSALQPKAVRPEEVEPGTLCTWEDGSGPLMVLQGRERMWWDQASGVPPAPFKPQDRIIPLPDQE